jgi:hypothetical protein
MPQVRDEFLINISSILISRLIILCIIISHQYSPDLLANYASTSRMCVVCIYINLLIAVFLSVHTVQVCMCTRWLSFSYRCKYPHSQVYIVMLYFQCGIYQYIVGSGASPIFILISWLLCVYQPITYLLYPIFIDNNSTIHVPQPNNTAHNSYILFSLPLGVIQSVKGLLMSITLFVVGGWTWFL